MRLGYPLVAMLLMQFISGAYALTTDVDTMFAASIIEIRGHLLQALENKKANNLEYTLTHISHPLAEIYPSIKDKIARIDPQLAASIEDKLTALQRDARVLSVEDLKAREDEINTLLHKALFNKDILAGEKRSDVGFWASVMLKVLEDAHDEYEEGVNDNKIINIIEWQDATGFVTVLKEDLFPTMLKNRLEQGLSASLEQLLATLLDDMNNAKDVSNTIDTINNRQSPLIKVGEEEPSIPKIKDLLSLALNAYQAGKFEEEEEGKFGEALSNYEKAKEYITTAYEKHFLPLKQYIEVKDASLMSSTEEILKDLPMLIDDRVSVEELKSKIDELNVNMDKIIAIGVIPEFPLMAGIVFASAMLMALAYRRGLVKLNKLN